MAEIRHALQHEVLQSCDERLLAFVNVSKAFKKKKTSILCISVTKETPFVVNIYQVTRVNNLILNECSTDCFIITKTSRQTNLQNTMLNIQFKFLAI